MPTTKKQNQVQEIKNILSQCTIVVATGYQGMSASNMTDLRARLKEQGIEYKVIKNTLTLRAANELGTEGMSDILIGPTALAFGDVDMITVAKGINGYITTNRIPVIIHGAVMDGEIITASQVVNLASLPPRDELISRLLGQMQAPIAGLVTVLSAPIRGLVTILQRLTDQENSEQDSDTDTEENSEQDSDTDTEENSEQDSDTDTEENSEQDSDTDTEEDNRS